MTAEADRSGGQEGGLSRAEQNQTTVAEGN